MAPDPAPAVPAAPGGAPLARLGVVVTRDEAEDGRLTAALEAAGANVLHWPTIRAAPPRDPEALRAALGRLGSYDWLVLTSRRAVEALGGAAGVRGPRRPRVAAVGPATAAAAEAAGWHVDLVPETETGDALVVAMASAGVGAGTRVLFPASEIARPTVPNGLARLGARVDRVTAYRIVPAPLDREACGRAVESGLARVVTVTSPSSVTNLRAALGGSLFEALSRVAVFAAIGPTTGLAAWQAGAMEVIEAEDHTLEGLVGRVVEWSRSQGERGAR